MAPKVSSLLYGVDEVPPVYLLIPLAIQQFLTCFGAVFSYPLIIAGAICISDDEVGLSEFINTVIFVCGLSSILQSTFGVRLPIIQGSSYAFITPVFVLMSKHASKCPNFSTTDKNVTFAFEKGSAEHRNLWQSNLSEISGALMVASVIQIFVGFSGLIGIMIRFIGPLTIAPTISLIGLSLFKAASDKGSPHWWICFTTIILITLFSQYLRNVEIPFFGGSKLRIFSLFPVLLGIVLSWLICLILTEAGAFPDNPNDWGYAARTDLRSSGIKNADWFRFPYPGQWGTPTVSVEGVLGILAAVVASMIESVGDYYACARLAGATSPPGSAIGRGIGMEGISCFLAAAWGTGGGNTSYSENIGAIGITKVGSRVIVQVAGAIMIVLGCVGKFGALFVMIPDPVVAGLFYVMFGIVTAVGISNLQFVDLNSSRNLFVFGFSTFFGLSVPGWVATNPFNTGDGTVDQILNVLCGTNMMVGGVIAFLLDNTIPGTLEERGLLQWREANKSGEGDWEIYEISCIQTRLKKFNFIRYIPFCPGFIGDLYSSNRVDNSTPEDDVKVEMTNNKDERPEPTNAPSNGILNDGYYDAEKQEYRF